MHCLGFFDRFLVHHNHCITYQILSKITAINAILCPTFTPTWFICPGYRVELQISRCAVDRVGLLRVCGSRSGGYK